MFSWRYRSHIQYKISISYCIDIDTILPNCHFMLLKILITCLRFSFHQNCLICNSCSLEDIAPIFSTKFPFHVFVKILVPDSRFSKKCFFAICRGPSFPTCPNVPIFKMMTFPKRIFREKSGLFLQWVESFAASKLETFGFGSHGHVPKSENMKMMTFSDFSQNESKQNNYMELSGHSFGKICNTNAFPHIPKLTFRRCSQN